MPAPVCCVAAQGDDWREDTDDWSVIYKDDGARFS
jgi:hypothetical protein